MRRQHRPLSLSKLCFLLLSSFLISNLYFFTYGDVTVGVIEKTEFTSAGSARHLLESSELDNYPSGAFSDSQLSNGAVLLHIIGIIYMFAALAIICDEFFVPSLEVISERLDLQDDVAGATFMAAGGSAPELATSFVGTFVSQSNVGFGTIVGSAVFNILFVIGACAFAAKSELELTAWPLARDSVCYSISLGVLIGVFYDKEVESWEAAILFSLYFMYVILMAFNRDLEAVTKRLLGINMEAAAMKEVHMEDIKRNEVKNMEEAKEGVIDSQRMHFAVHKLFESRPKSLNPLNPETGSARTKWRNLGKSIIRKVRGDRTESALNKSEGKIKMSMSDIVFIAMAKPEAVTDNSVSDPLLNNNIQKEEKSQDDAESSDQESDDDDDGPMDLGWPSTTSKQISYVILAPLTYLMYYTIPDVRREGRKDYFMITFFMSVGYIAFFSYFMVWWATVFSVTLQIPSQITGLTILAVGTSVPDLLESIIVTREGRGDMAISSSLGSNIFDVTVGLPLPWLLFTLINQTSIEVGTNGLLISVVLLFLMLISVIASISISKWKLSKPLGVFFFFLWSVFVTITLLVEML